MIARISTLFMFALLAVAAKHHRRGDTNQCNTGSMECCNTTYGPQSEEGSKLLGLVALNVGSITGLVGVSCSPLTPVGLANGECGAQPVCCSNNDYNGLVNIGCSPINL